MAEQVSIDEVTKLRRANATLRGSNEALAAALQAALSLIDGFDAEADSTQLVIERWRTQHRTVLQRLIENDES